MTKGNGLLRAVGYSRTSTDAQRDNTSIPIQKDGIERFVAANRWTLVGHYVDESKSGAKIAGRDDFQRMMRDAPRDLFDIVVAFDLTRFGRDGMDVLQSAQTLAREYGVHVVDTKGQSDTRDTRRTLTNFVAAGMSEDERLRILERTKRGKIAWARHTGAPVGTKRPFGRVWMQTGKKPSEGGWVVDEGKRALVEDVARRYLAGEQMPKLAREYRVNHANLAKVLRERCGPIWVQRVRCRELGIDEVIETQVPPLLPEQTIAAVRRRAQENRTFRRNQPKHRYLLGRLVRCAHCGHALMVQTNHQRRRYYRHPSRTKCTRAGAKSWVRAEDLEDAVMRDLFDCFGNPAAVRRAVEAALPDTEKTAELRDRLARLTAELEKVEAGTQRVIDCVERGTFTQAQAQRKMDEPNGQETSIKDDLAKTSAALGNAPTPEEVESAAERFAAAFGRARKRVSMKEWARKLTLNDDFDGMSWGDGRALAEMVLGGKTPEGKRLGVYVEWPDEP